MGPAQPSVIAGARWKIGRQPHRLVASEAVEELRITIVDQLPREKTAASPCTSAQIAGSANDMRIDRQADVSIANRRDTRAGRESTATLASREQ